MKQMVKFDSNTKKSAYFSDDLQERFLLQIDYQNGGKSKVAVILMNPQNYGFIKNDGVLSKVEKLLEKVESPTLQQINIINLFPFIKTGGNQLTEQIASSDLHQLNEFKQNLATIKMVIKSADKIILAWGSLCNNATKQKFQTAIADIYHMIRIFNKEKNCYVFSVANEENYLDAEGNPFHPFQGEIERLIPIEKLWMENNVLNYDFVRVSPI